ncbi:MAG: helical backbone metal receptor, partial [Planctomycetota bacterium]|nr:helical backbone metal receptor [Planctomycetota bacterium]
MIRLAATALLMLVACSHQPDSLPVATLDSPATRAIVIGPSTAATLATMGVVNQVVGVSDYCTDPAFVDHARVGGQHDPSLERIAALRPDLVLIQGTCPPLKEWCKKTNTPLCNFQTDSWNEWLDEINQLGNLFGVQKKASLLRKQSVSKLAQVPATAPDNPRTLLVVGRRQGEASGLVVAGAASFLSELLLVAGGTNAVADNERDYFDLNEEALLKIAPEVVLELLPPDERTVELWRKAHPNVPAVRQGRIFAIYEPWAVEPGPMMPKTATLFAELLDRRVITAPGPPTKTLTPPIGS